MTGQHLRYALEYGNWGTRVRANDLGCGQLDMHDFSSCISGTSAFAARVAFWYYSDYKPVLPTPALTALTAS